MNCPKCNKELELIQNNNCLIGTAQQDVRFICENDHKYFTRIEIEDLLEEA